MLSSPDSDICEQYGCRLFAILLKLQTERLMSFQMENKPNNKPQSRSALQKTYDFETAAEVSLFEQLHKSYIIVRVNKWIATTNLPE